MTRIRWHKGCDALVVMTEWNEFKQLDKARLRDLMRHPILYDGRNIYEPDEMVQIWFHLPGCWPGLCACEPGQWVRAFPAPILSIGNSSFCGPI